MGRGQKNATGPHIKKRKAQTTKKAQKRQKKNPAKKGNFSKIALNFPNAKISCTQHVQYTSKVQKNVLQMHSSIIGHEKNAIMPEKKFVVLHVGVSGAEFWFFQAGYWGSDGSFSR